MVEALRDLSLRRLPTGSLPRRAGISCAACRRRTSGPRQAAAGQTVTVRARERMTSAQWKLAFGRARQAI